MAKSPYLPTGGGHDTKYTFVNGQIVNRVSGEAIPEDEPIMIFRARDIHAVKTIGGYYELVDNEEHRNVVYDLLCSFMKFARDHPERMREPTTSTAIRTDGSDCGCSLWSRYHQAAECRAWRRA